MSTITDYLSQKGAFHYKTGKEIATHCVFNDCDKDSRWKEAHLYINDDTWLYQCKKCMEQWNWTTLLKHFWDDPGSYPLEWYNNPTKSPKTPRPMKKINVTEKDVLRYHKNIPANIRDYLNKRWITDEIISEKQLWYGNIYWANWITIPIRDFSWEFKFFKLRRCPYWTEGNKYMFYPSGIETMLYGWENLQNSDYIVICEWEFDQMVLESEWILWVTSTWWAWTFKDEWIENFSHLQKIYICFDNDEAWKNWADRLIQKFIARFPEKEIHKINLPEEMWKDITDFIGNGGTTDEMMTIYSELIHGTDMTKFVPMTWEDVTRILWLTIKHDNVNKLVVFLSMLSAFTEESQFNVLLNAPSSSGKSYIPLAISKLFPEDSLMKLLYVSQNAFFHENWEYNKERNEKNIYLNRKIVIFIDQPRTELLARLRPLLSHDEKVLVSKITDKSGQWWNQTKNIVIHGYPVAIFCTASTELDEQEATRFILLSPETHSEKFHETISSKIESNWADRSIMESIERNPERLLLKERIQYIRDAHIDDVYISDIEKVKALFFRWKSQLKPRHQRDIDRFLWFIKTFALLNFPNRKREWSILYSEDSDIDEAWKVWQEIAPWQEYNISPYTLKVYHEIFIPAYIEYNKHREDYFSPEDAIWVPRKNIIQKHSQVYGRPMSDAYWRQEMEPTLANAWLITTETIWRTLHISPIADVWLT